MSCDDRQLAISLLVEARILQAQWSRWVNASCAASLERLLLMVLRPTVISEGPLRPCFTFVGRSKAGQTSLIRALLPTTLVPDRDFTPGESGLADSALVASTPALCEATAPDILDFVAQHPGVLVHVLNPLQGGLCAADRALLSELHLCQPVLFVSTHHDVVLYQHGGDPSLAEATYAKLQRTLPRHLHSSLHPVVLRPHHVDAKQLAALRCSLQQAVKEPSQITRASLASSRTRLFGRVYDHLLQMGASAIRSRLTETAQSFELCSVDAINPHIEQLEQRLKEEWPHKLDLVWRIAKLEKTTAKLDVRLVEEARRVLDLVVRDYLREAVEGVAEAVQRQVSQWVQASLHDHQHLLPHLPLDQQCKAVDGGAPDADAPDAVAAWPKAAVLGAFSKSCITTAIPIIPFYFRASVKVIIGAVFAVGLVELLQTKLPHSGQVHARQDVVDDMAQAYAEKAAMAVGLCRDTLPEKVSQILADTKLAVLRVAASIPIGAQQLPELQPTYGLVLQARALADSLVCA
eukprot:TRINITY_DN55641_c0_g1_i1.p1 TRINITY_DN55641_c0_g1~~TRINITY_DN55641_c0_g1_i1.p1  ORF type:complete len:520 (-),score=83.83 TRINITY_DN55641_c0_g1_i1:11-1570(-)